MSCPSDTINFMTHEINHPSKCIHMVPSDREAGIREATGGAHEDDGARPPPPGPTVPQPLRSTADAVLVLPGGEIRYYCRYHRYQAHCRVEDHGDSCKLTRTSKSSTISLAQGRPLGLLAAWLDIAFQAECHDHASHVSVFGVALLTHARRRHARQAIKDMVGGPFLMSFERPVREAEDEEPLDLP